LYFNIPRGFVTVAHLLCTNTPNLAFCHNIRVSTHTAIISVSLRMTEKFPVNITSSKIQI